MKKSIMLTAVLSALIALNSCKQNPSDGSGTGDTEKLQFREMLKRQS